MAYTMTQNILSYAHVGQNGTKFEFTITKDKSTDVRGQGSIYSVSSASDVTPTLDSTFDVRYASDPPNCVIDLLNGSGLTYNLGSLHQTRTPAITGANISGGIRITIPNMYPGEVAKFDILAAYEPV